MVPPEPELLLLLELPVLLLLELPVLVLPLELLDEAVLEPLDPVALDDALPELPAVAEEPPLLLVLLDEPELPLLAPELLLAELLDAAVLPLAPLEVVDVDAPALLDERPLPEPDGEPEPPPEDEDEDPALHAPRRNAMRVIPTRVRTRHLPRASLSQPIRSGEFQKRVPRLPFKRRLPPSAAVGTQTRHADSRLRDPESSNRPRCAGRRRPSHRRDTGCASRPGLGLRTRSREPSTCADAEPSSHPIQASESRGLVSASCSPRFSRRRR